MVSAAVGSAMAKQLTRVNHPQTDAEKLRDAQVQITRLERELAAALEENQRLNAENDRLAIRAGRAGKGINTVADGTFVNGRLVINQVEAAKRLNVPQYMISRWVKDRKIKTTPVPGRKKPGIFADELVKPPRGKPGRKKKG